MRQITAVEVLTKNKEMFQIHVTRNAQRLVRNTTLLLPQKELDGNQEETG